jgi:hypothetical protein
MKCNFALCACCGFWLCIVVLELAMHDSLFYTECTFKQWDRLKFGLDWNNFRHSTSFYMLVLCWFMLYIPNEKIESSEKDTPVCIYMQCKLENLFNEQFYSNVSNVTQYNSCFYVGSPLLVSLHHMYRYHSCVHANYIYFPHFCC